MSRGGAAAYVVGTLIVGLIAYLGFIALSPAASLTAPPPGEPFYNAWIDFGGGLEDAILAGVFLFGGVTVGYLLLLRGR